MNSGIVYDGEMNVSLASKQRYDLSNKETAFKNKETKIRKKGNASCSYETSGSMSKKSLIQYRDTSTIHYQHTAKPGDQKQAGALTLILYTD